MFTIARRVALAVASVAVLLSVAAGQAGATEVTSQAGSEVDHMESREGSSGPGTVLSVIGYTEVWVDGVQQFDDEGNPELRPVWGPTPIGTGLKSATIIHMP
jgi:hypothetical protein